MRDVKACGLGLADSDESLTKPQVSSLKPWVGAGVLLFDEVRAMTWWLLHPRS
jgi:hypothetical protein